MNSFDLEGRDYIELHRLLKAMGICDSGGIAKLLIADGEVLVDGSVELRKRCKIRRGQTVEAGNQRISII
ncbi:MAG: RNA-binding S4 domain-containing protein [Desulfuromonadales bacterium]|jgi:ribosome-associated protein|nr:RNA-binding S4 domain-containing protein [Desulfuromonadales bacterium]